MDLLSNKWNIVAVGGTALGFCRDNDFIHWDFDIDLFAPIQAKSSLLEILMSFGCDPKEELMSIKATLLLDNGVKVPLGVDFFDENLDIYIDKYEDYTWQWPITMFTQCSVIEVHGKLLNVPNPPDVYLSKVYGNSWSVPNPEFCYSDYSGSVS